MRVGLGTGSTAAFAIQAIGRRVAEGLRITAFATSLATEAAARAAGVALRDFADVAELDLAVDGTDEIDDRFFAIKGAGGAMLREKVVAAAARRMVVIADASKQVARIGAARVPVEVLPFAQSFAASRIVALGGAAAARDGYRTDNGNAVLDCAFARLDDPPALAAALSAIPGVVAHGLFLEEVDAAYVASDGVVTRLERERVRL